MPGKGSKTGVFWGFGGFEGVFPPYCLSGGHPGGPKALGYHGDPGGGVLHFTHDHAGHRYPSRPQPYIP